MHSNMPSDNNILAALAYCGVSNGDLCNMCWYSRITGGKCMTQLMHDTIVRMKDLLAENELLKKEKVNERDD